MMRLVLVLFGLCVCLGAAWADNPAKPAGQPKEPGKTTLEDVWSKVSVKLGALVRLGALFEDPEGQVDDNYYFRVDNVFLLIKGTYGKDLGFFVQPHYSNYLPGGGTMNGADMWVEYRRFPVKIRLGKTQYPGSFGAFQPTGKLDFITRPAMCTETALPQLRDIGLLLHGDLFSREMELPVVGKRQMTVTLYGMISNGKQPRAGSMGEGMMYTGRADLTVKGLMKFGVCYLKDYQSHELGEIKVNGVANPVDSLRYAACDLTVYVDDFRVGGEVIHGRIEDAGSAPWYFEGAYAVAFYKFYKGKEFAAEAGVRYQLWDRNTDDGYEAETLTCGVNIFFNPKKPHSAKLQVNYRRMTDDDPAKPDKNALDVLMQLCF